MSFSKAPLRRFNELGESCSPAPGTYHPRFFTDVSMAYKRRISYDRGSCSTFSLVSSYESSSHSCSPTSNSNIVLSNSSCHSRSSVSSISPQPQPNKSKIPVSTKFQSRKQTASPIYQFKSKSPVLKHSSLRNLTLQERNLSPLQRNVSPQRRNVSPQRRNVSPQRRNVSPLRRNVSPQQRNSSLSEKVAMEIISAANETDQRNWLNTIRTLQSTVYEMQLSLSALSDEVNEEKERSIILEMKNKDLESMVENLQCRLIRLDELLQQTEHKTKIEKLTDTIENLQIAEVRLKENFAKLEQENNLLAKNMTVFVMKIVDLLGEQNDWKEKEKEYVKNISALDDIICENQNLLFQAEERLETLVEELENCCEYFCTKLKDNEEKSDKFNQRQIEYEESIKRLEEKMSAADQTFNEIQSLWNKSEAEYRQTIRTLRNKIVDLEYAFILFIFLLKKCNPGING